MQSRRLKTLARRIVGDATATEERPYLGLDQVVSWTGRVISSSASPDTEMTGTPCRAGDVLFGKLRPYLAKTHVAECDSVVGSEFVVLRPEPMTDARFLRYSLTTDRLIGLVNSMSYGSKMPRVSPDALMNLMIPAPSREAQSGVADNLDAETSRIDELIAEKQRFIELLAERRLALVSHVVTKGLDPSAEMKESGVEWLGAVPVSWAAIRIKNVAGLHSGHTPDKKVARYWEDGTVPWVSLADSGFIRNNRYISEPMYCTTPDGIANSSAVILPARSVILSRDATVGLCAITTTELAVSQHFMAWVCGDEVLDEYLLYVIEAMRQELERLSMGSTIQTIGLPHIKSLSMPLPPLTEQRAIAAYLDAETAAIDELADATRQSIDLLKEYRTALISAAVTGQIDISSMATPGESA